MFDSAIKYDFVKEIKFGTFAPLGAKRFHHKGDWPCRLIWFISNGGDCPSAAGIQSHSMALEMGLSRKINVDHCDNSSLVLFTFLTVLGHGIVKPCSFYPLQYFLIRQAPPLLFLVTSLHLQIYFHLHLKYVNFCWRYLWSSSHHAI